MTDWTPEQAERELAACRREWCFTNATVFIENHAEKLIARAKEADAACDCVAMIVGDLERLLGREVGSIAPMFVPEHIAKLKSERDALEAQVAALRERAGSLVDRLTEKEPHEVDYFAVAESIIDTEAAAREHDARVRRDERERCAQAVLLVGSTDASIPIKCAAAIEALGDKP